MIRAIKTIFLMIFYPEEYQLLSAKVGLKSQNDEWYIVHTLTARLDTALKAAWASGRDVSPNKGTEAFIRTLVKSGMSSEEISMLWDTCDIADIDQTIDLVNSLWVTVSVDLTTGEVGDESPDVPLLIRRRRARIAKRGISGWESLSFLLDTIRAFPYPETDKMWKDLMLVLSSYSAESTSELVRSGWSLSGLVGQIEHAVDADLLLSLISSDSVNA